jgi:hypothetical protein
VYLTGQALTEGERAALTRAADREFRFLQGIEQPGIDRPIDLLNTPRGPALIFRLGPGGQAARPLACRPRRRARPARAHRAGPGPGRSRPVRPPERAVPPRPCAASRDGGDARRQAGREDPRLAGCGPRAHLGCYHGLWNAARGRRRGPGRPCPLAPETLRLPGAEPMPADIWSLGALAFLILPGKPPAADLDGLHAALREQGHLSLAAAMDAPDRGR